MTEIKRYEMNHKGLPEPDDKGVWVFHEDHAEIVAALNEKVQALASERLNVRDVMLYAANNIAYAISNLSDKELADLKPGLSETICPTDSALLAERELRDFAARIRKGEIEL